MVPLGIDKEKLMLQLEKLEENLSNLKELPEKVEPGKDAVLIAAAERLLQVSTEACLNIGNHLISGLSLKRADTYKEIFIRLEEEKIISEDISSALQDFTAFRNRLVHLYWKITQEEVLEKINEIDYFKKFAQEILKFIKARSLL